MLVTKILLAHVLRPIFGIDDLVMGGIAGLAGGGANIASSAMANAANEKMQLQAQAYNTEEAKTNRSFQNDQAVNQMNFQREMSSSAYQRSRHDMELAGLNPIMMAGQGGASSPAGQAGSGAQASSPAPPRMESMRMGDAIQSALSSARDVQSIKQAQADTNLSASSAAVNIARAQRETTNAKRDALSLLGEQSELPARTKRAKVGKMTADFDESMVQFDSWAKRITEIIGLGVGAGALKRLFQGPLSPPSPREQHERRYYKQHPGADPGRFDTYLP